MSIEELSDLTDCFFVESKKHDGIDAIVTELAEALTLKDVLKSLTSNVPLGAVGLSIYVAGWDGMGCGATPPPNLCRPILLAVHICAQVNDATTYDQQQSTAIALQQATLPSRLPDVKNVRFAARYWPGGNTSNAERGWYDAFTLPKQRLGLAVGAVQGHDIRATAVIGQPRTAMQTYAATGRSPDQLMVSLDTFLRDIGADRFATCLYAELDPETGRTRVVRTGCHGLLVKSADGSTSRPELRSGLPLGCPFEEQSNYPVDGFYLGVEDTLLICSDGLLQLYDDDPAIGLREVDRVVNSGIASTDHLADLVSGIRHSASPQKNDAVLLLAARNSRSSTGFGLREIP